MTSEPRPIRHPGRLFRPLTLQFDLPLAGRSIAPKLRSSEGGSGLPWRSCEAAKAGGGKHTVARRSQRESDTSENAGDSDNVRKERHRVSAITDSGADPCATLVQQSFVRSASSSSRSPLPRNRCRRYFSAHRGSSRRQGWRSTSIRRCVSSAPLSCWRMPQSPCWQSRLLDFSLSALALAALSLGAGVGILAKQQWVRIPTVIVSVMTLGPWVAAALTAAIAHRWPESDIGAGAIALLPGVLLAAIWVWCPLTVARISTPRATAV